MLKSPKGITKRGNLNCLVLTSAIAVFKLNYPQFQNQNVSVHEWRLHFIYTVVLRFLLKIYLALKGKYGVLRALVFSAHKKIGMISN